MGLDGARLAVGILSVVPVRAGQVDRATAGRAMRAAPAMGLGLGLAAGGVGWTLERFGADPLLCAVVAVAALATLTRGLHLDGLADTADALGSARPAGGALDVMKASDIGPFGVVALVFVLLGQVAALSDLWRSGQGPSALVAAAVTGRLAVTWACRPAVPAARPEGLGALMAGTVAWPGLLGTNVAALTGLALLGVATSGGAAFADPAPGILRYLAAATAGLLAGWLLLRHTVRRLGGVTGDVFGALVETATTVTLVALTLG